MEQYDRRALYPMLVKSYNHLHFVGDAVELVLQVRMLIETVH